MTEAFAIACVVSVTTLVALGMLLSFLRANHLVKKDRDLLHQQITDSAKAIARAVDAHTAQLKDFDERLTHLSNRIGR